MGFAICAPLQRTRHVEKQGPAAWRPASLEQVDAERAARASEYPGDALADWLAASPHVPPMPGDGLPPGYSD